MKTIKIIDLLNKIANGEEIQKKIKWRDKIWTYDDRDQDYETNDTDLLGYGFSNHRTLDFINDEVEIIEEPQEHKIPRNIFLNKTDGDYYIDAYSYEQVPLERKKLSIEEVLIINKINEIIDYLEEKK